jgi:hypothetical protein
MPRTPQAPISSSCYAIAVPIGGDTLTELDAHRLALLDLVVSSFSTRLIPCCPAAAKRLEVLADELPLSDALRVAFGRGAVTIGSAAVEIAARARGMILLLDPRDLPQGQTLSAASDVGIVGLLADTEEENEPYRRSPGALSALLAYRYEQRVAGAALGLNVPTSHIALGPLPLNVRTSWRCHDPNRSAGREASEGGPPARGGTLPEELCIGICPSISLASILGAVTRLLSREAPAGARFRYHPVLLEPPLARVAAEEADWYPSRGETDVDPPPTPVDSAGRPTRELFALIAGGSVETDEEAMLIALRSGTPIIALDGPVSRELIRPGKTGFTFTPDSLEDIRLRIDLMINFPDERRRITDEARGWLARTASPGAVRTTLRSLVRSLVVSTGNIEALQAELAEPVDGSAPSLG